MKKIINPYVSLPGYNCFGCAPHNPFGVKMEFFEDGDDIVSVWEPRPEFQGWLHTLHGGIQSVLLDEICGWVVMRKLQTGGMTVKMETRYRHAVSTEGGSLCLRARLSEVKRNVATIEAELCDTEGRVCTTAVCTYFTFPPEKARTELHFPGCQTEDEVEKESREGL